MNGTKKRTNVDIYDQPYILRHGYRKWDNVHKITHIGGIDAEKRLLLFVDVVCCVDGFG